MKIRDFSPEDVESLVAVSNRCRPHWPSTVDSTREMIAYFARLQGVERPTQRTEELIERFDIGPFARVRCDRLSTGMRQKVSIARAVVHDPPILILDEPTAGLDVLVARSFLELVEQARDDGHCVLFSTHIMSEAERLCDRIAILNEGRILADDTLEKIRVQHFRRC